MATESELASALRALVVATVADLMMKNLDVTDDVAGRELHRELHSRLGDGETSRAVRDLGTRAKMTEWASGMAQTLRMSASMAVAAALDLDPDADAPFIARFVERALVQDIGEEPLGEALGPLSTMLARSYSSICRRSGLPPQQWAEATNDAVLQGAWAFPRN